ncbi:VWA domain-containing protein [Rhizobium sp. CG5]|uniref:VWA domain-containing protein n=1 Tax=Rhizobium sp. CG5 TaxID=2726076 RepID=UPI0020344070|nr:VWA domain-containing protein [Rhizobium sp. CG5]MCM2472499.1 VWA domain-containing protein [Rhizobium sp. CG5]
MHNVGADDGLLEAMLRHGEARWRDALVAAQVLAIGGPDIGGLWLTARAGGIRDRFLEHLRAILPAPAPFLRLAPGATAGSLCGRLDIARTTSSGRIVWEPGILAAVHGGSLVIPMAERLEPGAAAIIAEAMDTHTCRGRPRPDTGIATGGRGDGAVPAAFSVIALDEAAEPEETLPSALSDRLGLHVTLDGIAWQTVSEAPPALPLPANAWRTVSIDDRLMEQLFAIAASGGHASLRAVLHLVKVSRILAAMAGRAVVLPEDGLTALRLCLGIRLVSGQPQDQQQPTPPSPETDGAEASGADTRDPSSDPQKDGETGSPSLDSLSELLAAVERGSIDGLSLAVSERAARSGCRAGKAGTVAKNARRGRAYATSARAPFPDGRPDIVATLRAAAPWQVIRARLQGHAVGGATDGNGERPARLLMRKDDFRYQRLRHQKPSTAIFVVDASGSTALERLGETKGAIEQLLARCYVRRDEVSLIAFRGKGAELLMPPTRSLVAAKRKLSALPGGGPTPLASGLEKGLELALAVRRRGNTPVVVVMTDGSGNIALDGTADRALASRQAEHIARLYRANGLTTICIDIARRPREAVTALAGLLGADLHVLRQADSTRLSGLVNASMEKVS